MGGSGKNFLTSSQFIEWRDGEKRTLWCPGIPGVGKTNLASIVIHHLHEHCLRDRQTACVFAYFDHEQRPLHGLNNVASSVLLQLLQHKDDISGEIKKMTETKAAQMILTETEILKMLVSQLNEFHRVFLVVDALDECPDATGFLDVFQKFPEQVHLLFTSRPNTRLEKLVKADTRLEIKADDSDIREYFQRSFENCPELRDMIDAQQEKKTSFRDDILNAVVKKSQGMFLLASLHMKVLAHIHDVNLFKRELETLSPTPEDFYKTAFKRIKLQDDRLFQTAIDVLTWLTFAERMLTTEELAHAITISNSVREIQSQPKTFPTYSGTPTVDALTAHCAGLVVVDDKCSTIRLAHSTVQAYLKNEEFIVQHARSTIAETCLTCVSCLPVQRVIDLHLPQEELDEYRQSYPFLTYAVNYWGNHIASDVQLDGETYKKAWEFLTNKRRLNVIVQFMLNLEIRQERRISALHLAVYFGLVNLVRRAANVGRRVSMNERTEQGKTPLHWAVIHDQGEFLRFLVGQGADTNISDVDGRTALHLAIRKGDKASVQTLVSSEDIDLEIQDTGSTQRWTPLISAAANGQYKIAKLLLKNYAEVDARDKDGWTALRWATQRGHTHMAKLLLRSGASPEPPSSDHWTMLRWAAQEGRDDFINLLTERRVNLNAPIANENSCTALALAVRYRRTMTSWLLIQAGADINKPDNDRITPLHQAVSASENSLLFLLLESGADINAQNKYGLTPLHMAASRGFDSAVWFLLQKQANAIRGDVNERTPLHFAIMGGHVNTVHILIRENYSLVHAQDGEGRTALHYAATHNSTSIAEILLNCGANVNVQDFEGRTPLHVAVSQEYCRVVACLLRKGADASIRNKMKCSAVKIAASTRNKKIIEAIHQAGN